MLTDLRRSRRPAIKVYAPNFVAEFREINVTAHVAQNTDGRRLAIDGRTMRHRGLPEADWQFTLAMAAYNRVRLPKLLVVAA